MQAGVVGGSSQQASLPFNAERTVNLYPVLDQSGKKPASLYGRPGNNQFAQVGAGAGRGGFTAAATGRVFVVSGAELYEISSDGTGTFRGNLLTSAGDLTLAENGFQLAICDGVDLYIFKYSDNTFQRVVNINLPSASSVTFLDGYFIVSRALNSGIFQISAPYDGTSWAALDFATAESSPDSLVRVATIFGQLWLFGDTSIEPWSNTGNASFPFQRVNSSARLSVGTVALHSVLELDNTAFWVGKDTQGIGIVYRADGFSPQRISTEAIELRIQSAPSPSTLKGMAYQEAGHIFYIITGGGMETALVYDISTRTWFEWAYLNNFGEYELPITSFLMYGFNKTLALDRRNGKIHHQSSQYYSDNGDEIAKDRIFTHIFDNGNPFLIKNLTVNFETGVGNTTVTNPKAMLYLSNDGGRSFYTYYETALGKAGKFLTRAVWWRLGRHRQCTFRVRVTDSVKTVMTGGEFNT
jgi:hypothetical protein